MSSFGDISWQKEAIFWLLFFFFNFSLFAFHTLINYKSRYLNPFKIEDRKDYNSLFFSFTPDFYRICVEVSLILLFYRWFAIGQGFWVATSYYAFLLVYSIYHYSLAKFTRSTLSSPTIFV